MHDLWKYLTEMRDEYFEEGYYSEKNDNYGSYNSLNDRDIKDSHIRWHLRHMMDPTIRMDMIRLSNLSCI